MRKVLIVSFSVLLVACTGEIEIETPGMVRCTDTRDGEIFEFDNRTVHEFRLGLDGYSFVATDTGGVKRKISNRNLDSWLKCTGPHPYGE